MNRIQSYAGGASGLGSKAIESSAATASAGETRPELQEGARVWVPNPHAQGNDR